MWAAVYSTGPATVVLSCGSSSGSFSVGSGVSKLKIPLSPGKMTVQMIRGGQTIINYTPDGYTYITNPVTCKPFTNFVVSHQANGGIDNYNAWVGSASKSGYCNSLSTN